MADRIKICFVLLILTYNYAVPNPKEITFKNAKTVGSASSPTIMLIKKLDGVLFNNRCKELLKVGKEVGFPLVENNPYDSNSKYITFVYDNKNLKQCDVYFRIFGMYDEHRFGNRKLFRLGDSDIYYRTYIVPDDVCFSYQFILKNKKTKKEIYLIDPLNKEKIPSSPSAIQNSTIRKIRMVEENRNKNKEFRWSVLDLDPDKYNYNKRNPNIKSKIQKHYFKSKIMNNSRDIYIYTPQVYKTSGQPYPVIFLFDSFIYLHRVEVPNILDNLISEKLIKPMIAVFIDNPAPRKKTRCFELPMNKLFMNFIVMELVPHVRKNYYISTKQNENIIGGMSYGGLAAAYMAFHHSEIFGKVLSQSGSFWRDPVTPKNRYLLLENLEITDYLPEKFLISEKRNLDFYLDWGLQENTCCTSSKKLVKILEKRGYSLKYNEFDGWHDWSNSRKTFSTGLIYLLQKNNSF